MRIFLLDLHCTHPHIHKYVHLFIYTHTHTFVSIYSIRLTKIAVAFEKDGFFVVYCSTRRGSVLRININIDPTYKVRDCSKSRTVVDMNRESLKKLESSLF